MILKTAWTISDNVPFPVQSGLGSHGPGCMFCTYLALHDKPNGKGDSRVIIGQRLVHGIHAVVMSGRYRGGSMATLSSLQSADQTNIQLVSGRE